MTDEGIPRSLICWDGHTWRPTRITRALTLDIRFYQCTRCGSPKVVIDDGQHESPFVVCFDTQWVARFIRWLGPKATTQYIPKGEPK